MYEKNHTQGLLTRVVTVAVLIQLQEADTYGDPLSLVSLTLDIPFCQQTRPSPEGASLIGENTNSPQAKSGSATGQCPNLHQHGNTMQRR